MNSKIVKLTMALFWAAASVVTLLAFYNNIVVIVRWWQAFAAAAGDSAAMPETIRGAIGWLDWTAVDYSAVSTLIPFLGCAFALIGSVRILLGRKCVPTDFPYYQYADQLNVALGLFGTLWGIIVIGYFRLDQVSMADLMHCLHTALFSTLVAVAWVYLIEHPIIRPLMRKMLCASNLDLVETGDLEGAVGAMTRRIDEASVAFEKRLTTYEDALEKRLDECQKEFDKRIGACQAAFAKHESEMNDAFVKQQNKLEDAFVARQMKRDDEEKRIREEYAKVREAHERNCARNAEEFEKQCVARLNELSRMMDEEKARHESAEKELAAAADAALAKLGKVRTAMEG